MWGHSKIICQMEKELKPIRMEIDIQVNFIRVMKVDLESE
jgi:hypothetical protein